MSAAAFEPSLHESLPSPVAKSPAPARPRTVTRKVRVPAPLIDAGTVVDERFLVRTRIGRGGFGEVYRATDLEHCREVALKIMVPRAELDPVRVVCFTRETRVAAVMHRAGLMVTQGRGVAPTRRGPPAPYVAIDLIRGLPLSDILKRRGRLHVGESISLTSSLLRNLHRLHREGIVHRDIKPHNILIVPPRRKWRPLVSEGSAAARVGLPDLGHPVWRDLTGFTAVAIDHGVAKFVGEGKLGDAQEIRHFGTVQYMSPEGVLDRHDIDIRADLYSVAMLLHRMLEGRPAHGGSCLKTIALAHLTRPLPELSAPLDKHPISDIYKRAGARRVSERYPSAMAMLEELELAACIV